MAPHDNDRECERRAGRHAAGSRAPRVRLRRLPAAQAFKLGHYRPGTPAPVGRLHLDYQTLRENRQRLDGRRVVLTHMSADMLSRRSESDMECADDGQVIVV